MITAECCAGDVCDHSRVLCRRCVWSQQSVVQEMCVVTAECCAGDVCGHSRVLCRRCVWSQQSVVVQVMAGAAGQKIDLPIGDMHVVHASFSDGEHTHTHTRTHARTHAH